MTDREIDQNVVADVEYAELGPTVQRKVGEPVRHQRAATAAPAEVADDDLHIERADLGPEAATYVAKGDPIPPELAHLPRRPARAGARKK
jgi:hypothetical protein